MLLKIIQTTCTLLVQLPFSYLLTGCPTELVVLLCYGLLFFWLKFADRKGSWKKAFVFCIALWCAVFENQMFRKETTVAFLDVGQGDGIFIGRTDGNILTEFPGTSSMINTFVDVTVTTALSFVLKGEVQS